jgi:hypothetical protein
MKTVKIQRRHDLVMFLFPLTPCSEEIERKEARPAAISICESQEWESLLAGSEKRMKWKR